jgi:hypothetical protein
MTAPASPAGSKGKSSKPPKHKPDYGREASVRDKIVAQPSREPIPMKPRKGPFVALMAEFVAWVGVMLAMYVTTVRPRRHSEPPPPQSPPAATVPALAGESSATSTAE